MFRRGEDIGSIAIVAALVLIACTESEPEGDGRHQFRRQREWCRWRGDRRYVERRWHLEQRWHVEQRGLSRRKRRQRQWWHEQRRWRRCGRRKLWHGRWRWRWREVEDDLFRDERH